MFYKAQSEETGRMWDTWLYHEDGTYHLYYLANSPGQRWDNISMATSRDGVHWKELGPVLRKDEGVTWMGTGSTWKTPPGSSREANYQINFSQEKGPRQTIFFAESNDLVHWAALADKEFVQDERWYERNGRWDCIWTVQRPGGGLYGYWTATPKPETGGRFGFGETLDGVTWKALPPPRVEGVGGGEVGAIEKIGQRYYMLFGHEGHMVTLIADRPQGPFRAADRNRVLLHGGPTYFARFFPTAPGGLLVNHHSIAGDGQVWLGLLKGTHVDENGALRLVWWPGNENLKHQGVDVGPAAAGGATPMLSTTFDVDKGTILEGDVLLPEAAGVQHGLFIECAGERGAAILVDSSGIAQLGVTNSDGTGFQSQITVDREVGFGRPTHFRLAFNYSLLEFYLDDVLIECFSTPGEATGRVGLASQGDREAFTNLKAWNPA